jgi:hypothetical protein
MTSINFVSDAQLSRRANWRGRGLIERDDWNTDPRLSI